jgi:anti-sigma B factor antagonist
MADFNTAIREKAGVSIVDLDGYLDAHTAPVLENAFTALIDQVKFKIVVNFRNLSYISSAGLGVFMAFIEKIRENEGDIKFSNMSPKVYNIFDLLGFPLLYEFFEDEEEAVNKYNQVS